eukprot:TRINITY_DN4497_c0_g1_i1.p1 TRINITY_DN4497_c0_g1~~TRINITY_DN4497_c0_g1_i1.p1  ORF type:complete len:1107 (+),score=231.75 TRINITY_DN4497_c0_g1_i1:132-3452(+)
MYHLQQAPHQLSAANSFAPSQSWSPPIQQLQFVSSPLSQQAVQQSPPMPTRGAAAPAGQVVRPPVYSPRQPARQASTSPRPAYSWRSRALEPVGIAPNLFRASTPSGASTPDVGGRTALQSRASRSQSHKPSSASAAQRRTYRSVTRARSPDLQTRERNRQKEETARQAAADEKQGPPARAVSESSSRYEAFCRAPLGYYSWAPPRDSHHQQQAAPRHQHQQQQQQQQLSASHPAESFRAQQKSQVVDSPLLSHRGTRRVAAAGGSASGPLPTERAKSDVTAPRHLHPAPPPPSSWSTGAGDRGRGEAGMLSEFDTNSPQNWRRPASGGNEKKCISPMLGIEEKENNPAMLQQNSNTGSGGISGGALAAGVPTHCTQWQSPGLSSNGSSASLKYTEGGSPSGSSGLSFSMSPILQAPAQAAAVASSASSSRESPMQDQTTGLTSRPLSPLLCDGGSSAQESAAQQGEDTSSPAVAATTPSRSKSLDVPRSMGGAGSEDEDEDEERPTQDLSGMPGRSQQQASEAAEPVTPRGRSGCSSSSGEAHAAFSKGCRPSASKVAETRLFWEKKCSTSGKAPKLSTGSSCVSRGRSHSGMGASLQRSLSEFTEHIGRENAKARARMRQFKELLREKAGRELGSPAGGHSSGSEPSSPSQDMECSPNTQTAKTLFKEMRETIKITQKTQASMDFVMRLGLDGVLSNECSRCKASAAVASPVNDLSSALGSPKLSANVREDLASGGKASPPGQAAVALSPTPKDDDEASEELSHVPPLIQSASRSKHRSSLRSSTASSADLKADGKAVWEQDTTVGHSEGHSEIDSSRQSHSTGAPEDFSEALRDQQSKESPRPQFKESPRVSPPSWMSMDLRTTSSSSSNGRAQQQGTVAAASGCLEEEDELPGGLAGPEMQMCAAEEEENSLDSSVQTTSAEQVKGDESFEEEAECPQACQEGMPRNETLLHSIEQSELNRPVVLHVPEGMDSTRQVTFLFEEQLMRVTIPDSYEAGQQVTIYVPTGKRPPLEKNPIQAWHRGHHNWQDRHQVMEPLRHCCRVSSDISLDHPEYKTRYQLYGMLRGKSMSPLLPEMPEGNEDEQDSGLDLEGLEADGMQEVQ